jgi:hypothetical protein
MRLFIRPDNELNPVLARPMAAVTQGYEALGVSG